jgi:glycosyltransferase involved in cell wall biosynthesis
MTTLTYATITPARDEAENLTRLGASLAAQTVCPTEWIVVDDGSADGSREVVAALASVYPWIRGIESRGVQTHAGPLEAGRRIGRDVIAFNTGIAALGSRPDVLFKLDADVSFEPDFFELLLRAFEDEPRLGIAGGECLELEKGVWRLKNVTGAHVRGATRGYRWSCFEDVSPLTEQLGWDGIDEVKARLAGWETHSISGVRFRHHRRVGERDGAWSSYESQGATARFMGYRGSYLVARSLFRALRDPRALGMVSGWMKAAREGQQRYDDPAVRRYIRSQQTLRRVPVRALEALGRR